MTAPTNSDEAEEDDDDGGGPGALVLPSLQKLRKYCNTGMEDDKIDIEEEVDNDDNGKVSKKSVHLEDNNDDDYNEDDEEAEIPVYKAPVSKVY